MPDFPDIEAALCRYLTDATGVTASTDTPGDLELRGQFVRVLRGTGADDEITDEAAIDLEAFAPGRGEAHDLAEHLRTRMREAQGKRVGGVLFDSVSTSVGPRWVDYRNPAVHRFIATYSVAFRAY